MGVRGADQRRDDFQLGVVARPVDDRWMRDMAGWKPNITSFGFGAGYPVGSIATWYDDIAISATRVGCQF